ncbi:MAG: DNA-binding protein, partial [Planctomycetes bacterium]|nr:DNA-binding protein [Planctomycetota bacterium]
WACREAEVYQERRACEVMLRVLHELHNHIQSGDSDWQAIGGTPEGDQYLLPTTLAEMVLEQAGWQSRSLGASLPFDTLVAAVQQTRPRLFWLSVSFIPDQQAFVEGYSKLYEATRETDTALAVGGFALRDEALRQRLRYSAYCDTMRHLVDFSSTLRRAGVGTTGDE